jgi:hypothetical protein
VLPGWLDQEMRQEWSEPPASCYLATCSIHGGLTRHDVVDASVQEASL